MRFTDYGAFIDLGGIDGLLHISEISWGKLRHPQEVLQIGDTVKVKILSMNQDKETADAVASLAEKGNPVLWVIPVMSAAEHAVLSEVTVFRWEMEG